LGIGRGLGVMNNLHVTSFYDFTENVNCKWRIEIRERQPVQGDLSSLLVTLVDRYRAAGNTDPDRD